MHLLSNLNTPAVFAAICAVMIVSPLFARNLNPVQWSLQTEQEKAAPGSTIILRLHAQIADGYRLYSFTTPAGGPIKTTASVQANDPTQDFAIYQPKPDRHQDPNLNVPVETFRGGIDFLVIGKLPKNVVTGDELVTTSVRYQACSSELCLPPVTKTATTSMTIEPGATVTKASIPSGYQLVEGSQRASVNRQNTAKLCVFAIVPLTASFFRGS